MLCLQFSLYFALYFFYPPTVAGHTNLYVHFALFHTFLFIIAVLGPKKIKRLTFFHVPFFYIYNNVVAIDLCTDFLSVTLALTNPFTTSLSFVLLSPLFDLNANLIVVPAPKNRQFASFMLSAFLAHPKASALKAKHGLHWDS